MSGDVIMIMTKFNPYQTPESEVETSGGLNEKRFQHLANGQKFIIYAIALYILAIIVSRTLAPIFGAIIGLPAFILGVAGFVRVLLGSEMHLLLKIIIGIGMFIPFINLLALAHLTQRATKALKAAGYEVGFLGVKGERVA